LLGRSGSGLFILPDGWRSERGSAAPICHLTQWMMRRRRAVLGGILWMPAMGKFRAGI
jgi:hypothetical protein